MTDMRRNLALRWQQVAPKLLPFADVASDELTLGRLLRLSLFQVSVGMAVVLLTGTLNRVMIVELGLSSALVALMVALPLVFAPLRAFIGFRSDHLVSAIGWRRVPFIWIGTLLQFGGFAFMPFALLIMTGQGQAPAIVGEVAAAFAFILVGAGLHTVQTAGLALATDISPEDKRPRVVALLFVMLLVGMLLSALLLGAALEDYSHTRLVQVIQGAALITVILNVIALWKQEKIDPSMTVEKDDKPSFTQAWSALAEDKRTRRLLIALGLGTAGFTMQDILLEPFGADVLGMAVAETTRLTATLAGGTLLAFFVSARSLSRGADPHRLAAFGALIGALAFIAVSVVALLKSAWLFQGSVFFIGIGAGLFSVGMLVAAMDLAKVAGSGIALGAWGSVQATATGIGVALGGALRDLLNTGIEAGALGPAFSSTHASYSIVYQIEVVLLFVTLIIIGPLAKFTREVMAEGNSRLGLTEFPH
ncbi:MAG: BCD family MFS transporter [Pseudomonadota bacterium]